MTFGGDYSVGFTFFPFFVALVHINQLYLECTKLVPEAPYVLNRVCFLKNNIPPPPKRFNKKGEHHLKEQDKIFLVVYRLPK